MIRFYILVNGRVQGVGFRAFTFSSATSNSCTGWVRNLENGCVEIELQGKKEDVLSVLSTISKGNQFIHVDDYQVKEISIIETEKNFKIRY